MRVDIDINLKGKELFSFLKSNKKDLINTKKSLPIYSESGVLKNTLTTKSTSVSFKEAGKASNPSEIDVKVIANMSMYADSYMDVLGNDSFNKTISERGPQGKNLIPHLVDHNHSISAKIGVVNALYGEYINLSELGIMSDVQKGRALVMESTIKKTYNEKLFQLYSNDDVNQHSIGLKYIKIDLALNDDEYEEEFKVWNKNFKGVINKDYVMKEGYFWYVSEYALFENSAVLFGANEVTPTLSSNKFNTSEPLEDTQKGQNSNLRSVLFNI